MSRYVDIGSLSYHLFFSFTFGLLLKRLLHIEDPVSTEAKICRVFFLFVLGILFCL